MSIYGEPIYLTDHDYASMDIHSSFEEERETVLDNPRMDPHKHYIQYTNLAMQWRAGKIGDTSQEQIEHVRQLFFNSHTDTPESYLWDIWTPTEKRFMANPGFAKYYTDHCLNSEWYPRWPLNIPTARAVVGPFGYGWDLRGNFGKYPITDPHAWWAEHHPVLKGIRQRGKNGAFFVRTQFEAMAESGILNNRKQRILVLSAGYMPCFTMLNYRADPSVQEITACDMDPKIRLEDLKHILHEDAFSAVHYENCRNEDILNNEHYQDYFDIILMDGGYVYYPPNIRSKLLNSILRALHKGGVLVFDDQVIHDAMSFAQQVFNWGIDQKIYLEPSMDELVKHITEYATDGNVDIKIYPIDDVMASIKLTKT